MLCSGSGPTGVFELPERTGLVVVKPGTHFSVFGAAAILYAIQNGSACATNVMRYLLSHINLSDMYAQHMLKHFLGGVDAPGTN